MPLCVAIEALVPVHTASSREFIDMSHLVRMIVLCAFFGLHGLSGNQFAAAGWASRYCVVERDDSSGGWQ